MISHKFKCIFIHIPKCAGTSIESKLGHLDGHNGRGGQDHRAIRMIEQPYFIPKTFSSKENIIELLRREKILHFNDVQNFRNKYTVTKDQYETYFKFTIVRNPWSRAFSWYKNVMRDETHLKTYGITSEMPFGDFLARFGGKGALRPQIWWIKSFDGSIPMNFIGRFENLQEDIKKIFENLKIEDSSLPYDNKGSDEDYRYYYDSKSNDIILNIYKEDIDLFDYKFD